MGVKVVAKNVLTVKKIAENILTEMPFPIDSDTQLAKPTALSKELSQSEKISELFAGNHQFDIKIYSEGEGQLETGNVEHWIWQVVS